ncbi:MAG: dihydrofolate reductase family protein [Bacteroidota bacterium]
MRKLSVFNFITLNGFYKGPGGDISWHKHGQGDDEREFAAHGAQSESVLLFGRVTYEMMASYWPTEQALKNDRAVAEGMNKSEKIVFSKTLKKPDWSNTRVIKDNIVEEIRKLKKTPGNDLTILGSGSIVSLFAEHGLIDTYQFMVDPLVIGSGTPIFHNIKKILDLRLIENRAFKSGVLLLGYEPAKK